VGYLWQLGVVAVFTPPAPATSVDWLLCGYRDYLRVERGLATTTVELNVRMVRPFLLDRAAATGGCLDLAQLTASEVNAFVVAQARLRPRSVMRMVTALRSQLGFPTRAGHHRRRAGDGGALAGWLDADRPAPGIGGRSGGRVAGLV
jgi:integrase/recombinase XerD